MTHLVIPSCSGVLDAFNTRLSRYYRKESFCCLQGDVDTLLALAVFSYIYLFPACCSSSYLWEFKISDFKKYLGYVGGSKSKDLQTALLSLQKAQYMWEYKTFDKAMVVTFNQEKTRVTIQSEYFSLLLAYMKSLSGKIDKWGRKIEKGVSTYSSLVHTSILKERCTCAVEVAIELVKLIERRGPLLLGESAHISTLALKERCPTLYTQLQKQPLHKERNRIMKKSVLKALEILKKHTVVYEVFEGLTFDVPSDFSINSKNVIQIIYLRREISNEKF